MSPTPLWRTIVRATFTATLTLVSVLLLAGGVELLLAGGSAYYLVSGVFVGGSALLVWRRHRLGLWLYGAMLAGTAGWALSEVGLAGWPLVPRLVAPLVLGAAFFLPGIQRDLRWPSRPAVLDRASGWLVFAGCVIAASLMGLGLHAIGPSPPPDPLYDAGVEAIAPAATPLAESAPQPSPNGDWLHYGNDSGGTRFSPLDQLNPMTVSRLKVAWQIRLGGDRDGKFPNLEGTPLKVGQSLYICTGYNDVLSIDAETGHVNWRFRSGNSIRNTKHAACRGVAYYAVPNMTGPCATRVYTATIDARLIALDATTGRPCPDFGDRGHVNLLAGMSAAPGGFYYVSSAPTLVRGKLVLGGWVSDNQYWGEPSGVIRAFDAVSGRLSWAFDMGRPDRHGAPEPGKTYTPSTPNSWGPMSADEALGLVYAPTGNATPDYYGVQRRPFDERYTSSVVALDADTGNVRWSFQTAHHDLWDYDVASQPTLVDLPTRGGVRRALVQPTKRGEIFLLDRVTGQPISTVAERPVSQTGHVPGERISPTQPFSISLPSFRGADLREADMWGVTPLDQLWCRLQFRKARYDGPATPPGLTPSLVFPGFVGGIDWGGVSIDRDRHLLIVNSMRMPNYDRLLTRAEADGHRTKAPADAHGDDVNLPQGNTPYGANVKIFLSPLGVPCIAPPYGRISAVDLVTHKLVWSHPLGTARDSGPFGMSSHLPIEMGLPDTGGSLTTRGGLVFIGAVPERAIRAFDVRTGQELWQARLPFSGHATPMTYISPRSGRQFVVIMTGGNSILRSPPGDMVVAYALPR